MADKDKNEWLRIFYNNLHFEPVEELRRRRDYSKKISFREALDIGAQIDDALMIQIVMIAFDSSCLHKKVQPSSNSIVVLPQWFYSEDGEILEVEKPIIYENEFYSLDDFIETCPGVVYGVQIDGIQDIYSFSLSYLLLTADDKKILNKNFLTSIRKEITKTGFEIETRGKVKPISSEQKERNNFIIKEYEALEKKKPIPITKIQNRWAKYLREKYPNKSVDKQLNLTEATIRRIVKTYTKK